MTEQHKCDWRVIGSIGAMCKCGKTMNRTECNSRLNEYETLKKENKRMKRNKPDANQKEIVDALEDLGVVVFKIGQPLDLLLAYDGALQLQEVKNPEGENKISESQQKTIDELRAVGIYVPVVRSVEDSILGIGGFVAALYKLRRRLDHLRDELDMKWREIGEMEEFNGVSYGTLNGVYNGRVPKDDSIRARLGLK